MSAALHLRRILRDNGVRHREAVSCSLYRRPSLVAFTDSVPFSYNGVEVVSQGYDFVISSFPREPLAKKMVLLLFRPDMVEKMDTWLEDIVTSYLSGADAWCNT